jgi:hypothetical protein
MSFAALPPVPQAGVPEWQFQFLNSVRQNVEELTGQRGRTGFQSIIGGQVTVLPLDELAMRQVTARGEGFTISGSNVPSLDDHVKLIVDVQNLINDVQNLRLVLNTLIQQLQT